MALRDRPPGSAIGGHRGVAIPPLSKEIASPSDWFRWVRAEAMWAGGQGRGGGLSLDHAMAPVLPPAPECHGLQGRP